MRILRSVKFYVGDADGSGGKLASLLGERRNVSGVVLRVGNSRLPHESLARKTLDFVLRPRAVSIVGKLCQVVHGHNAELADFFECVNLGIPEASIPCSGPYTWFGFVGLGFAPSRACARKNPIKRFSTNVTMLQGVERAIRQGQVSGDVVDCRGRVPRHE